MARQSSTFTSMPNNPSARRRIYRTARLGRRPRPTQPNIGDAMHTLTAVSRYKEWFDANKGSIEFLQAVEDSWKDRKDWP